MWMVAVSSAGEIFRALMEMIRETTEIAKAATESTSSAFCASVPKTFPFGSRNVLPPGLVSTPYL